MSQVFGILVLMYVGHVGKDLRPVLTTLIPCLHPSTNIRLHHRKPSAQSVEDGNHSSDSQGSREAHAEMHTTMSTSRLMRRAPIHEHWSPTTHSYGAPARRCYLESSPVPERQNYKYHGPHHQSQRVLTIKDSDKLQPNIFATGCPTCVDFILDSHHSQHAVL